MGKYGYFFRLKQISDQYVKVNVRINNINCLRSLKKVIAKQQTIALKVYNL